MAGPPRNYGRNETLCLSNIAVFDNITHYCVVIFYEIRVKIERRDKMCMHHNEKATLWHICLFLRTEMGIMSNPI